MSFRNFERGDSPESNAESPEKSTQERADANEDKKLTSRIKDFFNPDKKKETIRQRIRFLKKYEFSGIVSFPHIRG